MDGLDSMTTTGLEDQRVGDWRPLFDEVGSIILVGCLVRGYDLRVGKGLELGWKAFPGHVTGRRITKRLIRAQMAIYWRTGFEILE